MKNISKLIFMVVVTLSFSMTSFARNPAAGNDPNAEISSLSEAGTMVLGSDFKSQKGVCVNCQNRNNLKLSDKKDNFQPGSTAKETSEKSDNGQSHK
jgi:hypothetical protein